MRIHRAASTLALTCALSAFVVFPQPAANAQPAPAASPAAMSTPAQPADDLFLKGKALMKDGKKQDALQAYRAAWKLRKSYDVAGNLGSLELDLGLYRDAAEHMAYALSHYAASGTTRDQLDKAKQRLESAKKEVCTVRVAVSADGAEVIVDGVSIGRAPLTEDVFVNVGAHSVEARLPGYVTVTKTLDAKKGATEEVKLSLEREPPSALPTATASVTATAPLPVPRSKLPAFVIGGVSAASLIAGGVLVGVGFGKRADILSNEPKGEDGKPVCYQFAPATGPDTHPECAALRASASEGSSLANAGVVFLAVGGAAAAGAVVYLLWPESSAAQAKPKASSRVLPVVAANGGGLVWSGSF